MEINNIYEIYNKHRSLYYTNGKETAKKILTTLIQNFTIEDKKQILNIFHNYHCWKEYDYFIYSKLLQGCENYIDVNYATYQILNAFPTKELVIMSLDILKSLSLRINIQVFMKHFFELYGDNPPDMSYYAYLLPTIKNIYADEGLHIVQETCTKQYSTLYKLHALKFNQRITFSDFISNNKLDVYNDCDSIALLFELICKRREKMLPFDKGEIDFIYNNLCGIDPPAINYFKYFLSHVCMTCNRLNSVDMNFFLQLQNKCYLLLSEDDPKKVKRGVRIYADFYNCIIKSQYKTNYTLTTKDLCESQKSFVYYKLNEIGLLKIGNDINLIVSFISDRNFFLFEEIFGFYDCSIILSMEDVLKFFTKLEDIYLDDKIDVVIKLLVDNWYKDEKAILELIEMILCRIVDLICVSKPKLDYNLYRNVKTMAVLIENLSEAQGTKLEDCLMKLVDIIITEKCLKENKGKLYERLIVSALDLLVKLSTNNPYLEENKVDHLLIYLEKGIFCNKRYAASASGLIYRKFITSHYETHKNFLIKYVTTILRHDNRQNFDSTTSNMRRCLEKRILVHEFCLGVNRSCQKDIAQMICNICMDEMNKYSDLMLHTDNNALKMYIFCMNAIMADASLKRHTFDYIFPLIKFCLDSIDAYSKDFSTYNAIYSLYATLIQRLLPYQDNNKNMHIDDLNTLCPEIFNNFDLTNKTCYRKRHNASDSPANNVLNHLWNHFDNWSCGFDTESAIKLWVNLIPQKESTKIFHSITSCKQEKMKGLNNLHLKYKLLEGMARKCDVMRRREELFKSLQSFPIQNITFYTGKIRIKMGSSLEKFCLKPLTIEQSINRICSKKSTIYDKINAFEFCFDYFARENKTDVFIKHFLISYIQLLCSRSSCTKIETFSACFSTIVYCLDQLPYNFEQKLYICSSSSIFNFKSGTLSKSPNLLAFLAIFLLKIDFFEGDVTNLDVNSIRQQVIHGYLQVATQIDSLQLDDAESVLIGFKYLKYYENINNKDLFLISMQFLHSELFSEIDYLLEHVFKALDICNSSLYVTASCLRRFLLSKSFLEKYFECPRSRIIAVFLYLRWVHTKI